MFFSVSEKELSMIFAGSVTSPQKPWRVTVFMLSWFSWEPDM